MQNALALGSTASLAILLAMSFSTIASAQSIVAHRGASWDAPENTMAAFELAWEQDADAIEGDFYLTRDGHIVCIHDRTTERVAGEDLVVEESTLEQLQALDVGSWKGEQWADQRVPTLEDVMATVPEGRKLFVDIKSGVEIVDPIAEAFEASALAPEQVVMIAFNADVVAAMRERLPQVKSHWLVSYRRDDETGAWRPGIDQVFATLERIEATGLSTNANTDVVDASVAARLREQGYEFHTWTINDTERARYFAELGVDSITTDRPGHIREQLGLEPPTAAEPIAAD